MLAERTARRLASALRSALQAQLEREALDPRERTFAALDVLERRRAGGRLAAIELELLAVYRADRRTVQLAGALADRLRESERVLLAGLASALAPGRMRDELIRADVGATSGLALSEAELVRELRDRVPVDELLAAMLRALRGHDEAIAIVRRTLEQLAAAAHGAPDDGDEPELELEPERVRGSDPYPSGDPYAASDGAYRPRAIGRGDALDPFADDSRDPYGGGPWG